MKKTDIVVTGIGIVSPLGRGREATWRALVDGKTGITAGPDGLSARVPDFSPNGARSRAGDFALLAAKEALEDAGLDPSARTGLRIACGVSQSKPLLGAAHGPTTFLKKDLDPSLLLASFFGWSIEAVVQRDLELSGPTVNIAAACATGVASIQWAVHLLEAGEADIALAGAAESSLLPLYRAGFQQMGVLADGNDPRAVRPFDRRRSGFAMGEGAAVLVLESADSARRRGRRPLARVGEVVMAQSPGDALRFDEKGETIAALVRRAVPQGWPDYVNAHGTGTMLNDSAEIRGLRSAFGESARDLPVGSTKAATGHMLGAAGAVEAAFAVLALRDGIIPPTLHWEESEAESIFDHIPDHCRSVALHSTLSLSYGFGGQMGAVRFDRWEQS